MPMCKGCLFIFNLFNFSVELQNIIKTRLIKAKETSKQKSRISDNLRKA